MYGYGTGTSLNRVGKLSLPVQALGLVRLSRTPTWQDAAAERSIFCTAEMTFFLVAVV